ncbi:putative protein tag-278 [Acanthaster planci]|uniref:Uncharacterized protein n=1 Tax=Acanthaster planci TaxID=133434 RepID=A0A8B7XM15_ACAPL|nr:putative protein tag-278 [Acanthaster planci]
MIISLTLLLGYLSSSLKTAKEEMESTSDEAESKLVSSLHTTLKHGRFPAFIRDKLDYFRTNSSILAVYRRRLHEAEEKITALTSQYKVLNHEREDNAQKRQEMSKAFEEQMNELIAKHKAQVKEMQDKSNLVAKNMDKLLKDHISLKQVREQIANQVKENEAKMELQENTNGVLAKRLHLAEKSRAEILKKLEEFEGRYAENMARFQRKYKNQEMTYQAKLAEQEAKFEAKYSEQQKLFDIQIKEKKDLYENKHQKQESTFESRFKDQQVNFDERYNKQKQVFDAKYKEQHEMFDKKCKQQEATFNAAFKAQEITFENKVSEQKAKFDAKFRQQEVHFAARLQNEKHKCEELKERNDALADRLKYTEAALLKSRQVKVNQEYEFTDTVSSLVPKEAFLTVQEQCQLYKKTVSVLAATVLILLGIVFVGWRFLFN